MENRILPQKLQFLSGSMLKMIAVICMVIDHGALILAPVFPVMGVPLLTLLGREITLYYILRKIGRLAFPLFCYLIAEGFVHTKSPIKYMFRLLIFALISELPFDWMVSGKLLYFNKQNVYFTLLLGVLMLFAYEKIKGNFWKLLCVCVIALAGRFFKVDYGMNGVLLILLLYVLRNHPVAQALLAYPMLSGGFAAWCSFGAISAYNGKRGFASSGVWKYIFYIFYPAHILLLLGIRFLLS